MPGGIKRFGPIKEKGEALLEKNRICKYINIIVIY
jgi:hypothetical protein